MNDDIFDKFIVSLEEMIDAQDDMWEEEKYENVHARRKIFEERFIPAKGKVKEALDEYIDKKILDKFIQLGIIRNNIT